MRFRLLLARLLGGMVLVPLLATAAFASHALELRCRFTGQAMTLARCCPKATTPARENATPMLRAQSCCSLERVELEPAPSDAVAPQVAPDPALAADTHAPGAVAFVPSHGTLVTRAPRPPPLAERLARKQARLI